MIISGFYENIKDGAEYLDLDIKKALTRLKMEGMEKVYISYSTLQQDERNVLRMLSNLGLGVEGLYGFFRFDQNPEDDSFKGMIDCAVRAGAGNVLLVAGFIEDEERKDELKKNIWTGLRNAVEYGRTKDVAVSIEDFDGLDAPYCSAAGVEECIMQVPGLRLSFDTGNFVMYHDDELCAFETFQDYICTVHVKDRKKEVAAHPEAIKETCKKDWPVTVCADGERICTVPVGSGDMKIKEIIARLKQRGYEGSLIAELYGSPVETMYEDMLQSVCWIRDNLH